MDNELLSGVLIVHKPQGITSHDVVGKIRKLYHTRQVGHTGTLDPMATGVLVILIGRAAKASEYLSVHDKHYVATMRLGLTTDTQDITGQVLSQSDNIPELTVVQGACREFVGNIQQIPPMFSALKVNGQKLVDLARKGQTVERESRPITIYSLTCSPTSTADEYLLDIHCSSGTYVRTLCHDIGQKLACGAVMTSLERNATGAFLLSQSYTLDSLETMNEEERKQILLPVESLFSSLPSILLPDFYANLCRNGCEIYEKKIRLSLPGEQCLGLGTRCTLWRTHQGSREFFALGEVQDFPDGLAIKAIKIFTL